MAQIPRVNKEQRMTNQAFAAAGKQPYIPPVRNNATTPVAGGAIAARQARLQAQNPTRFAQPQIPKTNTPQTGGGVVTTPGQPRAGSSFKVGTTLEELNAQKAKLKGANRLGMVNDAIAKLTPQGTPAPTPEVTPTVDTPAETTPPADVSTPESTFKSTYDFLPATMENDPIYKSGLERGTQRINRLLASRGLIKSGAEVEANNDLERDLQADAYGRQIQTATNDANRFDNNTQFDSTYRAGREDAQWDRFFKNNDQMLQQSPMSEAYKATGSVADLRGELGNKLSAYLKDKYKRVQSSGGGGGGGSAGPGAFVPPSPSGPDYSMIDLMEALGGGASNQGYGNAIISTLPYLFK